MTPILITTPASHYCEKARWALDRARITYVEEVHVPLFSRLRAGGTVPVLIVDEGKLRDSTDIVKWVDRTHPLYEGDAAALEDGFDQGLGPAARRVAFQHLAPLKPLALRMTTAGTPRWEASLASAFFKVAIGILRRIYRVRPETVETSLVTVRRAFAEVGARLADGRRYLCGDAFTAADLTFAALAGPVLLPEGGGATLPAVEEVPAALAELSRELRSTPAGKFALRMYAQERRG